MTGSYHGRGGRVGMSSALPGGAHTPPRSPKKWKTTQPSKAASKEPERTPTTAWSRSAGSENASSAMNKATVKPIPARVAPPTSWPRFIAPGRTPSRSRKASSDVVYDRDRQQEQPQLIWATRAE
jgi:hypothetical protein